MIDDGAATRLLEAMVRVYSPSGQEGAIAELLVDWMQTAGLHAWRDGAGNAVGSTHPAPSAGDAESGVRRGVLLLGHMDTVRGFIPVRRHDDDLYGRGAVDAKGPLAAFCVAAARLGPNLESPVTVVGAVEEEAATSKGARAILGSFAPQAVVIGEPSGWDRITVGYKGRLLIDAQLESEMGHTAGPEGGLCEVAVAFWQIVLDWTVGWNRGRDRLFDRVEPSLRTLNSSDDGFVERVKMTIGLRIPPGLDVDGLKGEVVAQSEVLPVGQARISFRGQEPPFRASRSTPLARAFLRGIQAQGGVPRFTVKTGTSDMNVVGPVWNCPILAYGPGDSALDHTPHEHIAISEYLRAIRVLEGALEELTYTEDRADSNEK